MHIHYWPNPGRALASLLRACPRNPDRELAEFCKSSGFGFDDECLKAFGGEAKADRFAKYRKIDGRISRTHPRPPLGFVQVLSIFIELFLSVY